MRMLAYLFLILFSLQCFAVDYPKVNGAESYKSDTYLKSTDFPNTTNLYGWNATSVDGNWNATYGGQTLVRLGALTLASDHLGNSRNNNFEGTPDCLYNSGGYLDANAFGNAAWSIAAWVNVNWSSITGPATLFSSYTNSPTTQGFALYFSSSKMYLTTYNATTGVDVLTFNSSTLSSGWHHVALVRSSSTLHTLYIDGMVVSRVSTTGLISSANSRYFNVGCVNSIVTPSSYLVGKVQDIWVHTQAWTSEEVKKVYARGSRLYVVKKPDGNVDVNLPLEGKKFNYTPTLGASTGTFTATTTEYMYSVIKDRVFIDTYLIGNASGTPTYISVSVPIKASTTFCFHGGGAYIYDGAIFGGIQASVDASNYGIYKYNNATFTSGTGIQFGTTVSYPWQ